MFRALQAFRFLFAVVIFAHHLGVFEAGGSCGVSFFLVLSGFVMAKGYGGRALSPDFSYGRYMTRRLVRLYPLHVVTLLLAVSVSCFLRGAEVGGWWWIPNACLLQSWIPYQGVYFSGNGVSWCLSDLMFFYAIFPWMYRKLDAVVVSRRWAVSASVILLMSCAYMALMCFLPEKYGNTVFYVFPLMRLPDFLLGMLVYECYGRLVRRKDVGQILSGWRMTGLEFCAIGGMAGTCWLYYHVPLNATFAFIFWIPSAFFILVFALSEAWSGRIASCLSLPCWTGLGNISFTFYMVHQVCIRAGEALWPEGVLESRDLWTVACFATSLVMAFVLHAMVERPIASLWKKKHLRDACS